MIRHTMKCIPLALLVLAGPVSAQAWDTPSFFSPRPGNDIGVYIFDPDGGDMGVEGIWRQDGNLGLGVRLGIGGDDNFLVGAEVHNPLNLGGTSPLLLSWVGGVGATFGDNYTFLRIPLGVSVGAEFGGSGIQIMPYVHPRVAFDLISVDVGDDEVNDSELNFDVDLGADVSFTPRLVGKFGATVTNGGAVGIGLAYRLGGRRVVVR